MYDMGGLTGLGLTSDSEQNMVRNALQIDKFFLFVICGAIWCVNTAYMQKLKLWGMVDMQ